MYTFPYTSVNAGGRNVAAMTEAATERLRVGRPTRAAAAELEERLQRAAVELFLEHGFDGTTMEAVARAAGITKRTLYARYPDKRALFAAVIPWAFAREHWDEPAPVTRHGDIVEALTAIARSAVARAVDPDTVRLTRIAMNESARFPEFAMSARSLTWSPRIRTVMDVLAQHAEDGDVVVDDLELAAEQFLAMVSLMPAMLAAFGVLRDPDVEQRHIEHAVHLFLRGALPR
jgi:AcrR family transcriptional regulator